ncbi:hypothetical protein E1B28_013014 [Marasmius oreades]|uniref:tyrosinase n=1 Tax=Marasmius oreades TaxID=181124 RepID=A0A9P7UMI8_9AGAR|nr:uncharacterized protein E1B28_013014 [Marasmius oreades]KAG7087035.1 hypothetical protein E1B28_013014 [Marasmius oreades]
MPDISVPIVGREHTGVHPRLSIDELQIETKQFALSILSYLIIQYRNVGLEPQPGCNMTVYSAIFSELLMFGVKPPEQALTFARIAGIHGLPYEEWKGDPSHDAKADYDENDPKDTEPKPSRFGGYCNHGSVLFPSWHRPYVMALEVCTETALSWVQLNNPPPAIHRRSRSCLRESSRLHRYIRRIWADTAAALRFPWWDWADSDVAQNGLPTVFSDDRLVLEFYSGCAMGVFNPLSFFPFQSIPKGFKDVTNSDNTMTAYFSQWMRTIRYAPSSPEIQDNDTAALNAALIQEAPTLRNRVASLFTLPATKSPQTSASHTFDEFLNHTVQSTNELHYYTSDSLEGVHDSMHDILGGNGNMTYPDYAGFDPIFFLHHCNVDRLYALWEYVYPKECYIGQWNNPEDQSDYSFTQSTGTYSGL